MEGSQWQRADFNSDGTVALNASSAGPLGIYRDELVAGVTLRSVPGQPGGRRLAFWTGAGWQVRGPYLLLGVWLQELGPNEIWLGGLRAYRFDCADAPGDLQCDGRVTLADIAPFIAAITNRITYYDQFPNCNHDNADVNQNGAISVADIGAFVDVLVGQ